MSPITLIKFDFHLGLGKRERKAPSRMSYSDLITAKHTSVLQEKKWEK